LYRTAFWTLFKWSPTVLNRVQDIRHQLGMTYETADVPSERTAPQTETAQNQRRTHPPQEPLPYVAVHIRTGRGKTFTDALFPSNNESTWPLYYQCAKALQRGIQEKCHSQEANFTSTTRSTAVNHTIPPPLVPIYVAADTVDVKKVMLEWGRNEEESRLRNQSTIKTLLNLEIYHIDRSNKAKFVSQPPVDAQLDVWAEMKLLIDSTCLVMSYSKFSRLGHWLSPQQPRCAVLYNDCGSERVQKALEGLHRSCGGGG